MIERFLKMQTELSSIVDLLSLLPNHLEVDYLTRAFASMKKFDSVTVMLQRSGMTFVEARELFDLFLKDYPDFQHHIGDEAAIIENTVFEMAVMNISRGLPLSEEQRTAATPLVRPDDQQVDDRVSLNDDDDDDEQSESYSQALQRKLKLQRKDAGAEQAEVYVNLDMLPGTSVNCERLFSTAKFILSDTRKRTSPTLFEALLLLKVNSGFWNVFSVSKAMARTSQRIDLDIVGNNTNDIDAYDDEDNDIPDIASNTTSSEASSVSASL